MNLIKKIGEEKFASAFCGLIVIGAAICEMGFNNGTAVAIAAMVKDIASVFVVVAAFFVAVNSIKKEKAKRKDKLDYLDNWEENVEHIYETKNLSGYERELLFGMQIATYFGKTGELIKKLNEKKHRDSQTKAICNCVVAALSVFAKTNRLTKRLTKSQYEELINELSKEYEKDVKDPDLAAWCKIFRNDKLELCYELYADILQDTERKEMLVKSIDKCNECIGLLLAQAQSNPEDRLYSKLYLAYNYRNISQLSKKLYDITGDEFDKENEREYCFKTKEIRCELYNHYRTQRKSESVMVGFITQEYILSLAEWMYFEKDIQKKKDMNSLINSVYNELDAKNRVRNMIFDKIEEAKNRELKKKKIAILCDYGLDDAIATLWLLEKASFFAQIDILAVGGNMPLSVTKKNAERLLTYFMGKVDNVRLIDTSKIAQPSENLTFIHGNDGMGDFLPESVHCSVKKLDYEEWIDSVDDSYTLLSLGPTTVTADILKRKGALPLILMGGNIAENPNYNGYEFNHGVNAEAFSETVRYPHTVATLDTCHHPNCDFYNIEPKGSELFKQAVKRYTQMSKDRKEKGCYIYDLVAAVSLVYPERFVVTEKKDSFGNMLSVLEYVFEGPLI